MQEGFPKARWPHRLRGSKKWFVVLRIVFLINTYPRTSHSFIRREVLALEGQGSPVHRFAMRSRPQGPKDPGDLAEDSRTEHVLKARRIALLGSALGWMALRPGRAIPALMMAWQMGGRADAQFRHLVYLMETAYVASRCKALKINYIHAYLGTNSASVAALVGALGGPGLSFTTRGPEKFDAPLSLSLGEKVAASRFTVAIASFGRSQLCRWSDPAKWHKIKVVHWGD